tara:strand:- start:249 stop:1022 length:774 start_codon:yes stop_codon:yes gene_type:complete
VIISSWNINSVRIRTDHIKNYLKKEKIDILFLQEIKCQTDQFPEEFFKNLGYNCYVNGQKSYNGVAIISKKKLDKIDIKNFKDPNNQSRFISTNVLINNKSTQLICIYLPNGNPVDTEKYSYKLEWLKNFIKYIEKLYKKNKNIIIGGDFNVIPEEIDVKNPEDWVDDALYTLEIRKEFRRILNIGFKDAFRLFSNESEQFTFWDYQQGSWNRNKGLRIDHFLVSQKLVEDIKNIKIDKYVRGKIKPSDHAPIQITF